jgi:hypothetical protein
MSLTIMAVGGIFLGLGLMLIAFLVDEHKHPRRRMKKTLRHKTT